MIDNSGFDGYRLEFFNIEGVVGKCAADASLPASLPACIAYAKLAELFHFIQCNPWFQPRLENFSLRIAYYVSKWKHAPSGTIGENVFCRPAVDIRLLKMNNIVVEYEALYGSSHFIEKLTKKTVMKHNGIIISKEKIDEFCRRHEIRKLSLFGSVLRGDFRVDSDIDVLVEFDSKHAIGLIHLARIERELSQLLGRKVDMRTAEDLSRYFREEVLQSAEVQYAR